MKSLLVLLWVVFAAGCSTVIGTDQRATSSSPSEHTGASGLPPQETAGGATATKDPHSSSAPLAVTVNPPNLPVNAGGGSRPAGWKTFSSTQLGVSLDYPGNWLATEQGDSVRFTSPAGAAIELRLLGAGSESAASDQQCVQLINSHDLSVEACLDASTHTYSAKFRLESNAGSSRQLVLSTTDQDAREVYLQMLDSLRPSR